MASEAEGKAMEVEGDTAPIVVATEPSEPLPHLVGKPYKKQADSIFTALFDKARQIQMNEDGSPDGKVSIYIFSGYSMF